MGEDLDIVGVDTAEGKDKSVATSFKIGENGEYRPIAVCESLSWDYVLPLIDYYEGLFVSRKRRKTTYKTIRRDCAKRNRGK